MRRHLKKDVVTKKSSVRHLFEGGLLVYSVVLYRVADWWRCRKVERLPKILMVSKNIFILLLNLAFKKYKNNKFSSFLNNKVSYYFETLELIFRHTLEIPTLKNVVQS